MDWFFGGKRATALTTTQLAAQLGGIVLDPDTLGLSNGASVSTMSDAVTGAIQLTAGATPFVADTTHLLSGHTAIATNGGVHTLANTAYSPIAVAGAAPTKWAASSWTMVAVVNCVTAAAGFGGGPYIGTEGTAKVALGTGGGAFGAGTAAEVFFVATTNGAAVIQVPWATQAQPSGPMIMSVSYDGARLRYMLNGAVDVADGVADGTINGATPVAQPGLGLSDGYAGNTSGTNRWYHVAWFGYCVPRTVLRNYQRSLAQRFGMATL